MNVAKILNEVEKLSPVDKAKVAEAIRNSEKSDETADLKERQDELNRRLLAKGVLKRIPTRNAPQRKFTPIKIRGKPLSETIIEERR